MGAKVEKFPIQELSIDAIRADTEDVQSRAAMSKEDEKEFFEAMLRGEVFPPVVVFWDGKRYILADGFHRYFAAKKAGQSIRAEVRQGDKQDAIIFSAGANKKFSIKRTPEDKKRAVLLILQNEVSHNWGDKRIAAHCGITNSTVLRYRAEFCEKLGIPIPEIKIGINDIPYLMPGKKRKTVYRTSSCGGRKEKRYAYCSVDGKQVYLGVDSPEAKQKYEELQSEILNRPIELSSVNLTHNQPVISYFSRNNLMFSPFDAPGWGLKGLNGHGCCICWFPYDKPSLIKECIGSVTLAKRVTGSNQRMVVLTYATGDIQPMIDLAKTIDGGIEFMTPEEFVADLKARGEGEPTS